MLCIFGHQRIIQQQESALLRPGSQTYTDQTPQKQHSPWKAMARSGLKGENHLAVGIQAQSWNQEVLGIHDHPDWLLTICELKGLYESNPELLMSLKQHPVSMRKRLLQPLPLFILARTEICINPPSHQSHCIERLLQELSKAGRWYSMLWAHHQRLHGFKYLRRA